jgi:hypothetical protein
MTMAGKQSDSRELTAKQERFAQLYIETGQATVTIRGIRLSSSCRWPSWRVGVMRRKLKAALMLARLRLD